ncbi:hypothetical protein EP331_04290 [bacterium]|nr:MAG: hypothetical protein EP331_04290 [bacterium]
MLKNPIIRKSFFIVLLIGVYFTVWRPIRSGIAQYVLNPVAEQFDYTHTEQDIIMRPGNSLGYYIRIKNTSQGYKELFFRVMGGMFFLFGCIIIVLLSEHPNKILFRYFFLQIGMILLGILLLFFGLYIHKSGIYLVDLLGRYGEPLINLGFVVIQTPLGSKLKQLNKQP